MGDPFCRRVARCVRVAAGRSGGGSESGQSVEKLTSASGSAPEGPPFPQTSRFPSIQEPAHSLPSAQPLGQTLNVGSRQELSFDMPFWNGRNVPKSAIPACRPRKMNQWQVSGLPIGPLNGEMWSHSSLLSSLDSKAPRIVAVPREAGFARAPPPLFDRTGNMTRQPIAVPAANPTVPPLLFPTFTAVIQ